MNPLQSPARVSFFTDFTGRFALGGVILLAVNEDIATTQRTMVNTVIM